MGKSTAPAGKGKQKATEPASANVTEEVIKPTEVKVKKPEKVKLRRLHVSGLPDITEQEAKDRFKSFGEVVGVDGLGKLDGTGKPLRYAFFDIKTTKSKLAQCMNLLSGAVWKGSTLRIAEAKPTIMERLEQERKQAAKQQEANSSEPKPKKDKKRKRDGEDVSAAEPSADVASTKSKAGWKLDPKTQTPIFPVIMRPDHPLPPPTHVEPVAGPSTEPKDEKAKKKAQKKAEKAEKAAKKAEKIAKKSNKNKKASPEASLSPPTRARLVKIDPTQWQAQHLREGDLKNLPDTSSVKTKKVKEKLVEPQPQAKKAKIVEKTPLPVAEDSSDDSSSEESEDEQGSPAPARSTSKTVAPATKATATVDIALETVYNEEASIAERKANLDMVAKLLGGIPKDLEPVQETIEMQVGESDSEDESEEEEQETSIEEVDVPEISENNTIEEDEEMEEQPLVVEEAETETEVVLSEKTVHAAEDLMSSVHASIPIHEAEDASEVMQHAEVKQQVQDDTVPQSSASSSSEDADVSEAQEAPATASTGLADVQMQSLTDMFKPQEAAAGFTIGDLLDDFEVDELETIAPPRADAYPALPWAAPVYAAPPTRPESSSNTLFFPFPLDEDELPGGILHDMSEVDREQLLSRSWTGTSNVRRFKRTQTIEEITTHYESVRRNISEQVRKRHREAVKRQKRHGGKRMGQGLADEA